MSISKRPRKVKVPWDTSSDIYAAIVTDDSLASNISTNFTGMEKDEENEIDLKAAVSAQANNYKHEIKTPEVNFKPQYLLKKSDFDNRDPGQRLEDDCMTSYSVISTLYAPDEEDLRFCEEKGISMVNLRWYFASAALGYDGFTTYLRYSQFPGMPFEEFCYLEAYFNFKSEKYRQDPKKCDQIIPILGTFRHQATGSYSCFNPRPPKIATRRKFQIEVKALQHAFEVRQTVFYLAHLSRLLYIRSLMDSKYAYDWRDSVGNMKQPKVLLFSERVQTSLRRSTFKSDRLELETKRQSNRLLKVIPSESEENMEICEIKKPNGIKMEVESESEDEKISLPNGIERPESNHSIENQLPKPEPRESRSCSVEFTPGVDITKVVKTIEKDVRSSTEALLLPDVAKLDAFTKRKRPNYCQKWMRGFSPEKKVTSSQIRTAYRQAYTEYFLTLADPKSDKDIMMEAAQSADRLMMNR